MDCKGKKTNQIKKRKKITKTNKHKHHQQSTLKPKFSSNLVALRD